ncbi:MAG: FAD-binding oxidoreductase [Gemmatimonadales bacterium]|nr:FAD-binding oxidoreductase [Gemmatimonadales bacterium]
MAIGSEVTGTPELDADALRKFEAALRGEVLRAGHPGYDPARALYNAMIDRHPALIVRCRESSDVLRALEFARSHHLLVAVRGGGHNVAGKALCDDGMVIDLSGMKRIQVDPAARTARAEAGLTWGEFDRETQEHGLATTGGFISTTGIAGLTLGGGLGWLMRKHGLACDNLRSVEIVTADGQVRTADATENPDLFWAVRGGGGNFGIVTSFEYRLHPVGQMLAGVVFFPLEQAEAALRFYRDLMTTAPDEVMAYAVFLTSPEGARMLAIPVCYVGPLESAEQILRPLRSHASVAADLVRPMTYREIQSMFDAGFPSGRLNYWKSSFLRELSDEGIATLVAHFTAVPSGFSAVAIEPFGGVVARVGREETAFAHRHARYSLVIVSMWTDPAESAANIRWTREFWNAMQPFFSEAVYVNYLDTDDADRVQAAYDPRTYRRLQLVKERYDPGNFFRVNQNIGPAL